MGLTLFIVGATLLLFPEKAPLFLALGGLLLVIFGK